jgi:hypothetical protein
MELEFSGEIVFWRGPAPWHFVAVPDDQSRAIADVGGSASYGWGCIPVTGGAGYLSTTQFEFAFAASYKGPARVFRVTPDSALVTVTDDTLRARFGPWFVSTPRANIAEVRVTGPYRWIKTAGSARLTFRDRGLTFATNGERGVEIHFHEPIRGIEPTGRLRHPNLTLTVADYAGLAALLTA